MRLAEPPTTLLIEASLFLDFDGTLVELTSRPDAVKAGADLLSLLVNLQKKLDGRIAVLSGRPVDDVSRLLSPMQLPIGGSHGLERMLPGGGCISPLRPVGMDQIVSGLRQLEVDYPGVYIEEKPAGVAIHYRLAPDAKSACQEGAAQAATEIGMVLQHGKEVVELKPACADKGSALQSFMVEPPFSGTRPIFVGDDLTDEHGFVAVRELGGEGVLVGPERPTAATYRLEDVRAVRGWLGAACELMS